MRPCNWDWMLVYPLAMKPESPINPHQWMNYCVGATQQAPADRSPWQWFVCTNSLHDEEARSETGRFFLYKFEWLKNTWQEPLQVSAWCWIIGRILLRWCDPAHLPMNHWASLGLQIASDEPQMSHVIKWLSEQLFLSHVWITFETKMKKVRCLRGDVLL